MKTASSSIEQNFARHLMAEGDVLSKMEEGAELEQNNRGWFNPLPELLDGSYTPYKTAFQFYHRFKFGPHQSARVIQHRVPKKIWNSYLKFTVERNPYDKMASMYFMNWGKDGAQRPGRSFEDWVNRGENIPLNYPLYTWKDKVILDRILRYENLEEELGSLYKEIGAPFTGLKERAKGAYRQGQHYRDVYTQFTRQRTEEIFKKELDLMRYSF
jgi:hypothetical protein